VAAARELQRADKLPPDMPETLYSLARQLRSPAPHRQQGKTAQA